MKEYEFTGKTVEEAVEEGLKELGLSREEAEICVLEEGKKGLFKSVKARVKISKKMTDGERAVEFLDGLYPLLNIAAANELEEDEESAEAANGLSYGTEPAEEEEYRARFGAAEKRLKAEGHSVMNPAWIKAYPGYSWEDYMRVALAMLDVCDAVYMLANWEDSRGAKTEHVYAKGQGKKIMYEKEQAGD